MAVQVEITTRCNFACFYCAGRSMRQGDMPYETFREILERQVVAHGIPKVVSLQGEGEPTLHPDFCRMARLVCELGSRPYTITNGTCKHPERFIGLFPHVGVSVDTLDASVARKIGRYNLARVISFTHSLAPHLQVVIHSVLNAGHTAAVAAWCRRNRYVHIVQPLQKKSDYLRHYAHEIARLEPVRRFSCGYLAESRMRYYTLGGRELPCPFIKDTENYPGLGVMLEHQQANTWPRCCEGCRYGIADERASDFL
jgi:pyruvate-formate lyase-activating enzyme